MTAVAVDLRARYSGWVAPLCWLAVLLEGFDLVVLGVVLPSLLADRSWGLTPNTASLISVVGLLGVMVGALVVGVVSDHIGRRRTMLWTVSAFSLLTLACAFTSDPWLFGLLRFLAGLGLGGMQPAALAMVNEQTPHERRSVATTTTMTGYHVGAVLTALLGILLIEPFGWQSLFVVGALPAVVLVPLIWRFLPESTAFLRQRAERADQVAAPVATAAATAAAAPGLPAPADRVGPIGTLFHGGLRRSTIAFWVTSFMGLLLVYGMNTWLPEIMRSAGYELGAALALLLVLNAGGVLGLLVAGRVADRIGNRRACVAWFGVATVFLALLSIKLPGAGVFVAVGLTGLFVFSSQVLVYAYVGRVYPASARGTALGASSGVGRAGAITGPLIGGWLLTLGVAYPWGFYVFAAVALVGALGIATVDRSPVRDEPLPSAVPQ